MIYTAVTSSQASLPSSLHNVVPLARRHRLDDLDLCSTSARYLSILPSLLTPSNPPIQNGPCLKLTVRSAGHFLAGHLYWKTLRQGTYLNLGLERSTRHIIYPNAHPRATSGDSVLGHRECTVQSRSPLSTGLLMLIGLS